MESKIRYELEFPINSSPQLLYQYISTPSGLQEWFADNVNSRGEFFTFIWDDGEENARLASKKSGELVGFLPFNDYLEKLLESQVADFANTSPNKNGAAITASLFLSKFIEDKNKKKWLHFDIAGPSYRKEVWAYHSYGATGVAIRLLLKFMEDIK